MKNLYGTPLIIFIYCLESCSPKASISNQSYNAKILKVKNHTYKTVNFPTSDGLNVYADYYESVSKDPFDYTLSSSWI